jgi:hypothetical protein
MLLHITEVYEWTKKSSMTVNGMNRLLLCKDMGDSAEDIADIGGRNRMSVPRTESAKIDKQNMENKPFFPTRSV